MVITTAINAKHKIAAFIFKLLLNKVQVQTEFSIELHLL